MLILQQKFKKIKFYCKIVLVKLMKKKIFLIILTILFLGAFIISASKIINWYKEGNKINNINKKTTKYVKVINNKGQNINETDDDLYWKFVKMKMIDVDFNELEKINKDTIMWINVNNTNINYPVVQKDNKFYLTHDYNKNYNSAGWVFLDYRNDINNKELNKIVYAHARLDKTMFGSLKNVLNSSWQNNPDNFVIKTSTKYENSIYRIFSIYKIKTTNDYIKTAFYSDKEKQDFINLITKRSIKNFNAKPNINDEILTLSTCSGNNKKIVVHAKKIKTMKR